MLASEIKKIVADHFGTTVQEITTDGKKTVELKTARQVCMLMLTHHTELIVKQIGKEVKDSPITHSHVIGSIKELGQLMGVDDQLSIKTEKINLEILERKTRYSFIHNYKISKNSGVSRLYDGFGNLVRQGTYDDCLTEQNRLLAEV